MSISEQALTRGTRIALLTLLAKVFDIQGSKIFLLDLQHPRVGIAILTLAKATPNVEANADMLTAHA